MRVGNVKSKRVQRDEIWAFCDAKQKNVEKAAPVGASDLWTWALLDADMTLRGRHARSEAHFYALYGAQQPDYADGHAPLYKADDRLRQEGGQRCHTLALLNVHYNFVRIRKALRCSPAMAAGVTDSLWPMDDFAELINAQAEGPKRPTVYKLGSSN